MQPRPTHPTLAILPGRLLALGRPHRALSGPAEAGPRRGVIGPAVGSCSHPQRPQAARAGADHAPIELDRSPPGDCRRDRTTLPKRPAQGPLRRGGHWPAPWPTTPSRSRRSGRPWRVVGRYPRGASDDQNLAKRSRRFHRTATGRVTYVCANRLRRSRRRELTCTVAAPHSPPSRAARVVSLDPAVVPDDFQVNERTWRADSEKGDSPSGARGPRADAELLRPRTRRAAGPDRRPVSPRAYDSVQETPTVARSRTAAVIVGSAISSGRHFPRLATGSLASSPRLVTRARRGRPAHPLPSAWRASPRPGAPLRPGGGGPRRARRDAFVLLVPCSSPTVSAASGGRRFHQVEATWGHRGDRSRIAVDASRTSSAAGPPTLRLARARG